MSNVLPVMMQRVLQNLNFVANVKSGSGKSDQFKHIVFRHIQCT